MKKNYKAIAAAMVGNALEYYDVMLYGFFATMLAPLFFPTTNPALSVISSFGTFAAGFIMRPIGGIVFGHLGDKFGRRYALVLAIFLVTIPTFTIGILPTYETIGILAPITLVACRLLQGLCVGGEYSGASIFVIEYSKKGKEAFAGGILAASGMFGGVIGTSVGFLCTLPFVPEWGWRIPFLLGSVMGLMGYYLRTKVNESPDFIRAKDEVIEKVPLWSVCTKRTRNLLCTIGIGAATLIPLYMGTVYMGSILGSRLEVPTSTIMLIHALVNIFTVAIMATSGYLADKVGKERQMLFSAFVTVIIAYPLFVFLESDLSIFRVVCVQVVLMIINVGFVAPTMAILSSYFPVHERYSGIGFGYALGGAFFGGTTPLLITYLVNRFESPIIPAYYLMFAGALGAVCVLWGKNKFGHGSSRDPSLQKLSPNPI